MTTATLKKNLLHTIAELPSSRLKVALDFLTYLKERDAEWEATTEILHNKKLIRDIRTAKRDVANKRHGAFASWQSVKRYV